MGPVETSIREMDAEDAAQVEPLSAQLGYPVSEASIRERIEAIGASNDHRLAVAEKQGRVVGWCHVFCVRLLESEGYAELGGLVVDQAFRRCGIGHALVQDAERWALRRGMGRLRAYSGNHRFEAHQFYKQAGYVQRETSVFEKHLIGSDD